VHRGSLWYRVLAARYGDEGGKLKEVGGWGQHGGGRLLKFEMGWVVLEVVGLRRVSRRRLQMGYILIFGMTRGSEGHTCVCVV